MCQEEDGARSQGPRWGRGGRTAPTVAVLAGGCCPMAAAIGHAGGEHLKRQRPQPQPQSTL